MGCSLTLRFKKLSDKAVLPKYQSEGAAGPALPDIGQPAGTVAV